MGFETNGSGDTDAQRQEWLTRKRSIVLKKIVCGKELDVLSTEGSRLLPQF
jgi:hypothetical protein